VKEAFILRLKPLSLYFLGGVSLGRYVTEIALVEMNKILFVVSDMYSEVGWTACQQCPAGYECASASATPVKCSVGSYSALGCEFAVEHTIHLEGFV